MVQGKTVKIGGVDAGPTVPLQGGELKMEDGGFLEVAGTVLVTEFVEESDLKDFLSCKSNLRWNHYLTGQF